MCYTLLSSGSFGFLICTQKHWAYFEYTSRTLVYCKIMNMKLVFLGAPSVVHDTLNKGDFHC